jgi:methionyl aminopeptidase
MITIKTKEEIETLRQGGKILANVIEKIAKEIRIGTTTGQIEDMACDLIKKASARPSFKGYKSDLERKEFPTALCISINNQVVHTPALPSRRLMPGDIVGIDLGIEYPSYAEASEGKPFNEARRGFYTDMAVTIPVGKISAEAKKLIKATKKSLDMAIAEVKPGNHLSDIGRAVQNYIESQGFSVVRDLVGHGVGYAVHEDPQIPNFIVKNGKFEDAELKPGMVLAIEPMVNLGSPEIKSMPDGFTIETLDGGLSAHFEHTVVVTDNGREVLTKI